MKKLVIPGFIAFILLITVVFVKAAVSLRANGKTRFDRVVDTREMSIEEVRKYSIVKVQPNTDYSMEYNIDRTTKVRGLNWEIQDDTVSTYIKGTLRK
jgi:hypothetical protein